MSLIQIVSVVVISYLIGSFSPGIFFSALKGHDIRQEGSKSSGATNVTRIMGVSYGFLTFISDILKAAIALLIAKMIAGIDGAMLAGIFTVLGHNWPIYYQFRGGKGVACSVAILVLICPLEGLIACAAAVLVIALTRYVSLGSLTLLAVAAILINILRSFDPFGFWSLLFLFLGIYQHRTNIVRLLNGKENRFSFKNAGKP